MKRALLVLALVLVGPTWPALRAQEPELTSPEEALVDELARLLDHPALAVRRRAERELRARFGERSARRLLELSARAGTAEGRLRLRALGTSLVLKPLLAERAGPSWLGITFVPGATANHAYAIQVRSVYPGDPADHAGVRAGDAIVGANGRTIVSDDEFLDEVMLTRAGDAITLTVERQGQELSVRATLVPRRDDQGRVLPPTDEIVRRRALRWLDTWLRLSSGSGPPGGAR